MTAGPDRLDRLLAEGPRAVNLGLEAFAADLAAAGWPVIHVDWRPPAGGDPRLAGLLAQLEDGDGDGDGDGGDPPGAGPGAEGHDGD